MISRRALLGGAASAALTPIVSLLQSGSARARGLAIAQRIALEHNGELSLVPSARGQGAVFRLLLAVEGPRPSRDEEEGPAVATFPKDHPTNVSASAPSCRKPS